MVSHVYASYSENGMHTGTKAFCGRVRNEEAERKYSSDYPGFGATSSFSSTGNSTICYSDLLQLSRTFTMPKTHMAYRGVRLRRHMARLGSVLA